MIKPRKWPRPADTALDRARAIAREYRALAYSLDPGRCAVLDNLAEGFGEGWVSERRQVHPDGLLTAVQLGEALGEKPATLRQWARRGVIPREPGGYLLDDVVEALARRRRARAATLDDTQTMSTA